MKQLIIQVIKQDNEAVAAQDLPCSAEILPGLFTKEAVLRPTKLQ